MEKPPPSKDKIQNGLQKKNSNTQYHISNEITRLVHSKLIKLQRFVLTEGNANG